MDYNYTYEADGGGVFAASARRLVRLIIIAVYVVTVIGLWKMYVKAGRPGWAAIIPVYNWWVWVEMIGRPRWWFWAVSRRSCSRGSRSSASSSPSSCSSCTSWDASTWRRPSAGAPAPGSACGSCRSSSRRSSASGTRSTSAPSAAPAGGYGRSSAASAAGGVRCSTQRRRLRRPHRSLRSRRRRPPRRPLRSRRRSRRLRPRRLTTAMTEAAETPASDRSAAHRRRRRRRRQAHRRPRRRSPEAARTATTRPEGPGLHRSPGPSACLIRSEIRGPRALWTNGPLRYGYGAGRNTLTADRRSTMEEGHMHFIFAESWPARSSGA